MTQTLTPALQAQLNNLPGFPPRESFQLGEWLAEQAAATPSPLLFYATAPTARLFVTVPTAGFYSLSLNAILPAAAGLPITTSMTATFPLNNALYALGYGPSGGGGVGISILTGSALSSGFATPGLGINYLTMNGVVKVNTPGEIGWTSSIYGWQVSSSLVVTKIA